MPTQRVQVTVSGEALQRLDRIRHETGVERDADIVSEALAVLEERLPVDASARARLRPRAVTVRERVRIRRASRMKHCDTST